jgi:hypothetical protein
MRNNLALAERRWNEQRAAELARQRQQMAEARVRVAKMIGDLESKLSNQRSTLDAGLSDTAFLQPGGTAFFGLGGGPGSKIDAAGSTQLAFVAPGDSLFSRGTKYSAPVNLTDTASDQLMGARAIGVGADTKPVGAGGGLQFMAPDAKPSVNLATEAKSGRGGAFTATVAAPKARSPNPPMAPETVAEANGSVQVAAMVPRRSVERQLSDVLRPKRSCDDLARAVDELVDLERKGILTEDVYNRYDPDVPYTGADMPGFRRISDDDTEWPELFRGMNRQTAKELFMPDAERTGYRAAAYRDKKDPTKIYLAFRGTKSYVKDFTADYKQPTGEETEYYRKAMALARVLKKNADAQGLKLELIGHSLGGGMAAAAGAALKIPTTTFNPAGVHPHTVEGYDISDAKTYVKDYVIRTDPLNKLQDHRLILGVPLTTSAGLLASPMAGAWIAKEIYWEGSMPAAIGERTELSPRLKDIIAVDPFRSHYMATVRHSINDKLEQARQEKRDNGCGR